MAVNDYYEGDTDKILNHAKYYCTTRAEKIEYLKWALHIFHGSPEYVLRETESEKIIKDRAERALDPEKFKRKYTKTITPADGPSYEITYFEEPDTWNEIENEIERLAGPKPEPRARKEQTMNFEILLPPDKNPDHIFQSANLYRALGVTPGTFANWKIKGLKIKSDYGRPELQDWKAQGYAVNKRTQNPLLKDTGLAVVKKDIVEFFRITGKLPEKTEQK